MSVNEWMRIIPVLKVNNRQLNQDFYEQVLGMKTLLEEGSLLSLGDQTKAEKLALDESPGTRSRRVQGPKKLAKVIVKVQHAAEIEQLLAQKPAVEAIYRGEAGYAFEALSPEGDLFLLHAEEDRSCLALLEEEADFEPGDDFAGLSQFDIEKIMIRVPNLEQAEAFYRQLGSSLDVIGLEQDQGPDLLADHSLTWDLAMLKYLTADLDLDSLSSLLGDREVFVPKSGKFLVSQDESKIELWFEEA